VVDGYGFITVFLDQASRGTGYGVDAFLLLAAHLFEAENLYKVYMDVYAYNTFSRRIFRDARLEEEGRFKGHRLHNGVRHDVIRYALYRDPGLAQIRELVFRLGGEEE
jgi:RimJ/RimL family protein N-acetyltransferase